jgi:hypothetical protein
LQSIFILAPLYFQLYDPNEPERDEHNQDRRFAIMNELCCGPYLVKNATQYLQGMRDLELANVPANTLQDYDQVVIYILGK